jgi:hypothetical protein
MPFIIFDQPPSDATQAGILPVDEPRDGGNTA